MTRRSALTVLATGLIVPAAVGLFVLARTQPRGNIRPPAASARPASPTPPAVPSPSPVPSSPSAEPSPSRRSPLSRE
ncbi:MAG: hypothetical protein ACRDQ2_02570, partial [Gaiellales bacterium]